METRIKNENLRAELEAWALDVDSGIDVEEYDFDDFEHIVLESDRFRTTDALKRSLPDYRPGDAVQASAAERRAYERKPEAWANRPLTTAYQVAYGDES